MIIDIVVITFVVMGLVLFSVGTLGILRLPDAYTRMHAAGKLDTLGSICLLFGLALWQGRHIDLANLIVAAKILLILVFVSFASPTATHDMVDAGMRAGIIPWRKGDKRR
ncbi:multisubunit sodium/proton antiporter, MrpG subunit [Desulfocurvibacter africanus PCS]|jgi:multicomponent Na+:H+ antiporter subunit G|uniref:Multisubunit sodium/proton antiporter, MrpG subunit n=1 Tax=Desulfocurvibacter africanus PCS TaxID=1262666 RepID=M5PR09_DESAF|nr:monovalent cation/H(+) antiporter subunit G [Desulfocurvibacter africanus]EMG36544.1 multisubunit sodium/proton antiporter, MrpG subunit [Desulfocurvibacter africanus PCS]